MATITNTVRWATNVDELKRNLKDGLSQIEATRAGAEKLVQSLGGDKLIAAAHRYAAAVQEIGGVASLTRQEQERVNTVVERAIAKYDALGKSAPTALRELAAATKTNQEHWKSFTDTFNVKDSIENPLGAATQAVHSFGAELGPVAVAGLGTVAAVAALGVAAFELTSKAAAVGGQLHDMAEKTGLSVPALSNLSLAAQVAGSDLGTMSSALFMFEKNLGEGTPKFEAGLSRLGLSIAQVKAAGPDQWLGLIAQGLKNVDDPAQRAAAAVELFGKQGREIIPTLMKLADAEEAVKGIDPWSADQAKGAEQFEMKVRTLETQIGALATSLGRELIPVLNTGLDMSIGTLAWFLTQAKTEGPFAEIVHQLHLLEAASHFLAGDVDRPKLPAAPPGAADQHLTSEAARAAAAAALVQQQLLEGHLTHLRSAYEALTTTQMRQAAEMLKGGDNAQTVATWLGVDERAVSALVDAQKEAEKQAKLNEAAAKKHDDALEHMRITMGGYATALDDVSAPLAALIQADLKHGGTVADVAEKYGIAQATVEQLDKQLKFTESVTEATTKAFGRNLPMVGLLTERYGTLHDSLHTLAGSWNEFHNGITVAGDVMANVPIPMFGTLPNVHPQNAKLIADARATGRTFSDALTSSMHDVPNVLALAFTGGGGASGAAKALGTKFSSDLFGEKGAFSGATKAMTGGLTHVFGDTIGKALGGAIPFIGPAIAAFAPMIIGGFKKLFGGVSAEEKKGREVVQGFEAQIASTLTASQKAEAAGDSWKMTAIGIRDAYLATGHSAAEADAATHRLWDSSKKSVEEQKAAAAAITDVLNLEKKAAEALPGILKDVAGGMNAISAGTVGSLNTAAAAIDKTKDGSQQAFTKIAESGKAEFDRTGRLAVTAFNAAIAGGKSFGEAITELGPTFDDLTKAQGTFGYATTETLQELLQFKTFASGPGKDVMSTLDGVNQMMSGLSKMGKLTQGDFDDLTGIATESFNKMIAGGVSSTQAMKAMQPTLQKIWELHKDQGLAIDDNTQKLLDEAETNGTIGEQMRDPQQQMLDVMKAIAKALGADLPDAAEKGVAKVKGSIDKIPKTVDVDFQGQFTPPDIPGGGGGGHSEAASTGGLVTALGIHRFALGGRVPWTFAPIGTDTIPAMLTPGELILNQGQQSGLEELLKTGAAMAHELVAGGKQAPVILQEHFEFHFDIQTIDGTDLAQTVETKLMPQIVSVIEDRRRGFTARLQQALGTT